VVPAKDTPNTEVGEIAASNEAPYIKRLERGEFAAFAKLTNVRVTFVREEQAFGTGTELFTVRLVGQRQLRRVQSSHLEKRKRCRQDLLEECGLRKCI